jgi:uncharacterized protein
VRFFTTLLFSVLGILFSVQAEALVAVPPLKSRVTDLTNTLNQNQRSVLEQTLAEFEARKGSQIAVLLVPTTQPEPIEQFAVRVEEAWKLGRKGVDDSVLLVIAKDDRKLKIETGYGLEGALPDVAAKRIIEEDITPRFKQGDFYGGIRAGVDRIMRTIEGEPLPAPRAGGQQSSRAFQHMDWLIPAVIALFIGGGILRAIFGRFLGSGLVGAFAAGVAWLVVGSVLISAVVGLFLFVTGLFGSASMRPRLGGWGGGGWSSGGGGFGGGGGGGFSGGGGSSGGGGASGSW